MVRRCLIVVHVLLLFAGVTAGVRADKIDDFVSGQMRTHRIPGLAVGIVRAGKLETVRGYGLANVELNVPVTKDTGFEIGSMTRQFTSALGTTRSSQVGVSVRCQWSVMARTSYRALA